MLVASPARWCRKHWRQAIGPQCAVREIGDLASLRWAVAKMKPDLVMVDGALLREAATNSVKAIRQLSAASRVIVLVHRPNDAEAVVALKAGALGYCDRNIHPHLIAKAVRVVRNGEIWIGRALISRLVDELALKAQQARPARSEVGTLLDGVSERQRQVLDLLGTGATNKEIARQLHLTTRTVKAHLGAVFAKVGIWGRVRLAAALVEHSRVAGTHTTVVDAVGPPDEGLSGLDHAGPTSTIARSRSVAG